MKQQQTLRKKRGTSPGSVSEIPVRQSVNMRVYEEGPILIADFAQKMGVHYQTAYAWTRKGRQSLSGHTVLLEVVNTSCGLATSMGAYKRFLLMLNDMLPD